MAQPRPPDPADLACEIIAKFEGCRLYAYVDQAGVTTIGFGCTGPNIKPGDIWTPAKAAAELKSRVEKIEHVMGAMVDVPLNPNQSAALVSLAYNIGLKAFENSTLRRLLNQGNYLAAADQFPQWDHAAGQKNAGLTNRRRSERTLYLAPVKAKPSDKALGSV